MGNDQKDPCIKSQPTGFKREMQSAWDVYKAGRGDEAAENILRELSKAFHVGYAMGRTDQGVENFEDAKKAHDLSHPDPFESD